MLHFKVEPRPRTWLHNNPGTTFAHIAASDAALPVRMLSDAPHQGQNAIATTDVPPSWMMRPYSPEDDE
jgi:hypothetical protein